MLTKKYQLIYNNKTRGIVLDFVRSHEGQETNIPDELTGIDFDNILDKEEFIKNQGLKNETTRED